MLNSKSGFVAVVLLLGGACTGAMTEPGGGVGVGGDIPGGVDSRTPFVQPGPGREPGPADPIFLFDLGRRQPAAALRMLTRDELAASIRDLTGVDPDIGDLPKDERLFNLSNDGLSGGVRDAQHVVHLFSMANDIAVRADIDQVVPCAGPSKACGEEAIRKFLQHVFFKPVGAAEAAPYVDIYQRALADGDVQLGKRAVLQSALTSPLFLYRTEVGVEGKRKGPLAPHELGAKLAYFLWGTPPDAGLEQHAFDGSLATDSVYAAEVDRLLGDARAQRQITRIFFQWLGLDRLNLVTKPAAAMLPATIQQSMETEAALLIKNVIMTGRKPLGDLLAGRESWMDQQLARLYGWGAGTKVKGTGFERVDLTNTERRGLLTTGMVLSAHGKESGRSPIQRGHFLVSELMCRGFPAAAGTAAMLLPPDSGGLTFRQRFEPLETADGCANCHRTLNAGFALDIFDEVGRRFPSAQVAREEAHGTFDLPPYDVVTFSWAEEGAEALANHPAVSECAVTQFYRYAQGRVADARDVEVLRKLVDTFGKQNHDMMALIKEIAVSGAFRSVAID